MQERDPQDALTRHPVVIPDDERYRMLVEHMPVVIYMHDGSRPPAMRFVSPQVETMLAVSAKRWVEQPFYWITRIHPDDRERLLAKIDTACIQERRSIQE